MALLWRRQEKIEKKFERYFSHCDKCFQLFEKALNTYFELGLGTAFDSDTQNTQDAESEADDLRRDIEFTLYGKALLPESRGDMLRLIENFDHLPGIAETTLYTICCQRMQIPEAFVGVFKELFKINIEAYYLARKAVDNLFNNPRVTLHTTKEVEQKESQSDTKEREVICQVFDSGMRTGDMILYRDLVALIGSISDQAESTADSIAIIAIKRQV
jgi:predicted phosphate transport protein (TIGR00153 family)